MKKGEKKQEKEKNENNRFVKKVFHLRKCYFNLLEESL